jgi:hypothetical protein
MKDLFLIGQSGDFGSKTLLNRVRFLADLGDLMLSLLKLVQILLCLGVQIIDLTIDMQTRRWD